MNSKKFELLLLKNTLSFTIPAICVFSILIFMFLKYPVLDEIKNIDIGNIANLDEKVELLYNMDTRNVTYTAKNLNYTGFDYYVDGVRKGAYYYAVINEKIMMFLVKTESPEMYIEERTLKGSIVKDNISVEHIVNQFAEEAKMDPSLFENYCFPYIISELDYPYYYIIMIIVFFMAPIVACVLIVIYTLLTFVSPSMNSQIKNLEEIGEPLEIVKELNKQLKSMLLFKKKNIYITEDYMVLNYLTRTDVIKLDNIKFLSKNIVEKRRYFNREEVFRLTISDPEKLFFEIDFEDEEFIDQVIKYIRRV